jgi:hypothetical protein
MDLVAHPAGRGSGAGSAARSLPASDDSLSKRNPSPGTCIVRRRTGSMPSAGFPFGLRAETASARTVQGPPRSPNDLLAHCIQVLSSTTESQVVACRHSIKPRQVRSGRDDPPVDHFQRGNERPSYSRKLLSEFRPEQDPDNDGQGQLSHLGEQSDRPAALTRGVPAFQHVCNRLGHDPAGWFQAAVLEDRLSQAPLSLPILTVSRHQPSLLQMTEQPVTRWHRRDRALQADNFTRSLSGSRQSPSLSAFARKVSASFLP